MSEKDPDLAHECLNTLVAEKRPEANPLLLEGYAMLGQIALDRDQTAEACVYFQLAANAPGPVMDGDYDAGTGRQALHDACRDMVQQLRGSLQKPRTVYTRPRSFENEADFYACDLDSLRWWAFGQNMPFTPRTDPYGLYFLRQQLTAMFVPPKGDYLLIPSCGEPRIIPPSQAITALSLAPAHFIDQLCTQLLYSHDVLERQMGIPRGYPEGHFFQIHEAIMHKQLAPIITQLKLPPNLLAKALLHLQDDIHGPVLVQMSYVLKHREARQSRVAARKPVTVDFLRSAEWKQMRMEFRALVGSETPQFAFITQEQVALEDNEAAVHHVHAR